MTLLVTNEGETALLDLMLSSDTVLRLYYNDYTPLETSVYADFAELNTDGYAPITLTGGAWVVGSGTATYSAQTFTMTDAVDAFGYYVTTGTTCLWAERFSGAPFPIPDGGGTISVTPTISLD
ncbi:hypothetical protein [Aeoliella sp.]|uniref:hypothetical protein n=1 Tax=Aeoliella sp. TaxID=2795800 RepID=UPI003CCB7952